METKEAILKRRSIRKYLDMNVDDSKIKSMLEAAMASASAINKRPWEFYVIKNKEIQNKIKQVSSNWNYNSPLLIVACGNKNNFIDHAVDFWLEDLGSATAHILLEATNLGLGSLWCGIYPNMERVNKVKEILKLKENIIPYSLIHIGYANEIKESRTQYEENKIHII